MNYLDQDSEKIDVLNACIEHEEYHQHTDYVTKLTNLLAELED